jgi:hypothetical protein
MASTKLPLGVIFIALFHFLSAFGYAATIFTTFPGEFDDDGGLRLAMIIVAGSFALLHAAVGVGLLKGKRLALLGAVALGTMNALPAAVFLIASIPLGLFMDAVGFLLPGVVIHGSVVAYLAFSKRVRAVFR